MAASGTGYGRNQSLSTAGSERTAWRQNPPCYAAGMITLSTEKGYARIESWDDVLSRPGFATDIDPRTVTLKSIIGSYSMATFQPCGLSSCHTPHGRGYLVACSDGRETNIGKDCGKKYFSVDFERMAKIYDRDLRAQERREALVAFQHSIPMVKARIQQLKEGARGANWIHRHLAPFGGSASLPPDACRVVARAIKGRSGALTVPRLATSEEVERMRAQGQRVANGPVYVDEPAGQLEGLAALYPENDLRVLLVDRLDLLATVEAANVDTLTDAQLRTFANWVVTVEPALKQAEAAIAMGHAFLTRKNLRQLEQFVSDKNERRTLSGFLQQLPE